MTKDWKECCDKRIAKEASFDIDLFLSLIKSSDHKLESQKMLKMTEVTATSKLSLTYDSLRELFEALALKQGYKIYNHECYTPFFKEILNESEKGTDFSASTGNNSFP